MTPVEAVRRVAEKTGWKLADVDLFELNEAFSVQALAVLQPSEVIGQPGEEVQVGQVAPVPGREHPERDGKILPGGVGHHLLGMRLRRANALPHARPFGAAGTSAFRSHPVIFQGARN